MLSQVVFTAISLVTSPLLSGVPCQSINLFLKTVSCISKLLSSHFFPPFCYLFCSYSSNFALIKSTDSCNFFISNLPLIWLSFVVLISIIIFIIFCSTPHKHLIKMSPQSGNCNLQEHHRKHLPMPCCLKQRNHLSYLLLVFCNLFHHLTAY